MAKYRKKPVVIDAFLWTAGPDQIEDPLWIIDALKKPWGEGAARIINPGTTGCYMEIYTIEGVHTASVGDFIIKGIKGELYPCKPDIFNATYDAV